MAFIGMDGAEHKIRQLTSQLQSKDAELASVRNELIKKSVLLAEEVKAKQALRYQMEQDSRGIESSSKDTTSLRNEVSILRQNLTNRETALSAANDTIKKLEKANQGLEYELQCAGSNSDESSRRLLEQKNKLETEVKGLKQELQRRDSEDIRLKAANAKVAAESSMQPPSGIPRLKRPPSRSSNTNFFGSAPTPSPGPSKIPQLSAQASGSNSNRRRSTSLSNTREIELQSKVSALETQLAGTRTKLDKAENQIMAVQRSARKHADDIERKLDEANDELEFYRSQGDSGAGKGGGGSKAELEQLRRSRDALKGTVEGLMLDLEGARAEIEGLKMRVVDGREKERSLQPAPTAEVPASATAVSSEEADTLRSRITSLEADLAKAQSGSAEPTDEDDLQVLSSLRKEIRKLKKELSLTQHMVSEAEKERDEFEEELEALKAAGGMGKKGGVDEAELGAAKEALAGAEKRVGELEGELEGLRVTIGDERAQREAEAEELRGTVEKAEAGLQSAQDELQTAQSTLSTKEANVLAAIEASSALRNANAALEADLQHQRGETETKERELAQCRAELGSAQRAVSDLESSLETVRNRASDAESQLAELVEVENLLVEARAEVDQLKSALKEMEALEFGAGQERDQARKERDEVAERITVVETELSAAEEERKLAVQEAEHERATVQATRSELEDAKKRLASRLLEIEEYSDQLQIAATDIGNLEQRNAELEEGMANRSTESEAQHRQEEVFQLKEDLEALRVQYAAKEAEVAKRVEEAQTATSKIAELEAVLSAARTAADAVPPLPTPETTSHANLLHAKIEKLRIERDELRQTMSFAKHEHRFAIQAAEADRASAMEELQRAKVDLKHRTVEMEKLQSELSGHREQLGVLSSELDSLRGRMAEVSTDRNDALDQQILQLQSELDESKADRENMRESSVGFFTRHSALQVEFEMATSRYTELTEHFQALQGQYSATQLKLAEVEKSRTVALAERDELLEKLDAVRPVSSASSALGMSTSQVVGELTAAEARMKRDMRRSSLMAFQEHAALEQGKKLELLEKRLKEERERVVVEQGKVAAEQERVKRREGSIRSLLQRVEKAEFNAQSARDDSDEKAEEMQAASEAAREAHKSRVAELESDISAGVEQLAQAKAELDLAQAALAESTTTVEALRADIARSTEEADLLNAQLVETTAGKQAVERRLHLLSAADLASRKSTSVLLLTLTHLQSTSAITQTALDTQTLRIAELEAELAESGSRLSALQSAHDALVSQPVGQEANPELDQLVLERNGLQAQIEGLEERCQGLEGELETLMLDMGAAEEAHTAALSEKGVDLAEVRRMAEEEKAGMVQREQEIKARMVELESTLAASALELEEVRKEMEEERRVAVEKQEDMVAKLALLEVSLKEAEEAHVAEMESKRAELDAVRLELEAERRTSGEKEAEMGEQLIQLQSELSTAGARHAEELSGKTAELEAVRGAAEEQKRQSEDKEREGKQKVAELESAVLAATEVKEAAVNALSEEKVVVEAREADLTAKISELESALRTANESRAGQDQELAIELQAKLDQSQREISDLTTALRQAKSDIDAFRATAQTSESELVSRTEQIAVLEASLAESTAALDAAVAERSEVEGRLSAQLAELSERVEMLVSSEEGLKAKAEDAEARVSDAESARELLQSKLDEAVARAEAEKAVVVGLREDLVRLESQLALVEGAAVEEREKASTLSKQVDDTRVELSAIQAELDFTTARLGEKQVELDTALAKNAELSTNAAQAPTSGQSEAMEVLEQQLHELQIICQSKDNDVDVATDNMTAAVVDKNKALVKIGKLERKIVKLEKAINAASALAEKEETARNTAANLLLMRPTEKDMVMAPPPIPAPRQTPTSLPLPPSSQSTPIASYPATTTTASSRQPLRSVNVFDKSQMPTSFSFSSTPVGTPKLGKRAREVDEGDISKLPAEAIMLPPSSAALLPPVAIAPTSTRKPVWGGFTPQRNAFAPVPSPIGGVKGAKENSRPVVGGVGAGAGGKGNVFAESTPRRNPFAVDP